MSGAIEAGAELATVLVATDFSATAASAVQRATALARERGARLVLTHVCGLHPFAAGGPPPSAAVSPQLEASVRDAADRRLAALASECSEGGLEVETYLETGEPGPRVLDLAEKVAADLIVVGTRGLSGLRHLILGSTAEAIVRGAPCPVLTVHENDQGRIDPPRTLLVASDFSDHAAHAARAAARIFGRHSGGAKVVLLHVYHLPLLLEPLLGDIEVVPVDFDEIVQPLTEDLEPAAEKLRAAGFEVECRVRQGDPSDVILEVASSARADVIAMGTHGRSGLKHMLLGSTAERVVQHAPCAVLSVRKE